MEAPFDLNDEQESAFRAFDLLMDLTTKFPDEDTREANTGRLIVSRAMAHVCRRGLGPLRSRIGIGHIEFAVGMFKRIYEVEFGSSVELILGPMPETIH